MPDLFTLTSGLPTPFLVLDQTILKRNIHRIHAYADLHGFQVRPHVKTHKSRAITRMQMSAGAAGIAVAKATEAQTLAPEKKTDITVAYPALGDERAQIIAELSKRHYVKVAVDSKSLVDSLSAAALRNRTRVGIHIIFDAGLHRCGVTDAEQTLELARYAQEKPGLGYEGIQLYLGHLYGDTARDLKCFEQINARWEPVFKALCRAGLLPQTVSSGSTPSLFETHRINYINEVRVGTAYINDYFVLKFNHCRRSDCAARVVATVVSDSIPGQVIIDAGSKSLSAKQMLRHGNLEMGYVYEYPEARIFRLHEEHGWMDVSRCKKPPALGQRISIIPVNVALCMNLYDSFYLIDMEGALQKERVDARGCHV
ncbi:alanine racemase [Desulfospira joergensenii]|uniref:alanine racemase n=1 Tax=Desulfospira joergensenii TaxID=53329 RepID=UPI0003B42EDB|nr:alanine racemase [Desulfospira joergensenii]